jgi:hypothetical protein
MIQVPEFATKKELFAYLKQNKHIHIQAKKAELKRADAVGCFLLEVKDNEVTKAAIDPEVINLDSFNVSVAINSTNLMDSHSDVHVPGIWNKSLKEQKNLYLLQEHKMEFKNIISDEVKAMVKNMPWSELGFNYPGNTQVLIFNAKILKDRNEYMAEQYAKGRVKNHSVGMRYVSLELAMNSESKFDREEKAVWDKYISQIANKEDAEAQGYFWAVLEAKIIEGSAVPLGSNFATPTISVGKEADIITSTEPSNDTQKTGYEIFKY